MTQVKNTVHPIQFFLSSVVQKKIAIKKSGTNQLHTIMVRYMMSFAVPPGMEESAQRIIDDYFEELYKNGPGGMRSQCYADHDNQCNFVHIKSFKKESVAHQHFRSPGFREYIHQLGALCGKIPSFFRLQQQQTFESIY